MKYVFAILSFLGSCSTFANEVGLDFQHFNPSASSADYVTVESAAPIAVGSYRLLAYLDYAENVFPELAGTDFFPRDGFTNYGLIGHLSGAFGLFEDIDVSFALPILLKQYGTEDESGLSFETGGLSEFRSQVKWRLLSRSSLGFALGTGISYPVSKNDPYAGIDARPTGLFYLVLDGGDSGDFRWSSNVGYRLRSPGEAREGFPVNPFGDDLYYSFATSYWWDGWATKTIFELVGAQGLDPQSGQISSLDSDTQVLDQQSVQTAGLQSSHEARLAFEYVPSIAWSATLGLGVNADKSGSAPSWRLFSGVSYSFDWRRKPREVISVENMRGSERIVLLGITFAKNSATIADVTAIKSLNNLVTLIKSEQDLKEVHIRLHTSSVGSNKSVMKLARMRSYAVKQYLSSNLGMHEIEINAEAVGGADPIHSNGTYTGRMMNERVEIFLEK